MPRCCISMICPQVKLDPSRLAPPSPRSLLDDICHSLDEAGGNEEGGRDLVSQENRESVRVVVREPVIEGHRDGGPRPVGPAPLIPGSSEGKSDHIPISASACAPRRAPEAWNSESSSMDAPSGSRGRRPAPAIRAGEAPIAETTRASF